MHPILEFVCDLFAGAFLCNAIPHLVSGLQGKPFPSPFAKPPGFGMSSPIVNTLWGDANLIAGIALLSASPVTSVWSWPMLCVAVGFMLIGLGTARHFGRVMGSEHAQK